MRSSVQLSVMRRMRASVRPTISFNRCGSLSSTSKVRLPKAWTILWAVAMPMPLMAPEAR